MRPVSAEFPITQAFGSLATAGVVGDLNGTQVQVLVAMYGDYQPFGHAGCDIGCPVGTDVHAIKAGTVVWCDWDINLPGDDTWGPSGYFARWAFYKAFGGRIILIQHDDGTYSDYCHLSKFLVTNGQRVGEGDLIALSGDSSGGRDGVLGPHLHTEYLVDLSYSTGNGLIYGRTDPTPYFGTTTPEDDMPLTPDDIKAITAAVLYEPIPKYNKDGSPNGTTTLAETAAWQEANFKSGRDAVMALLSTKLPAPDTSGKSYTVAEYLTYGWLYGMNAGPRVLGQTVKLTDGTTVTAAQLLSQVTTPPGVASSDPQAIADAIVNGINIQLTKKA